MTNQTTNASNLFPDTVIGRLYAHYSGQDSSTGMRLLLIVGLAVVSLLTVKIIRHISEWLIYKSQEQKNPLSLMSQQPKFITVTRLIVSGVSFGIYFFALGLVLQELFEINLTAYLASASIIGLAISFGSQGLVQDIVSGLTLIFCDAMDVGDLVEIAGTATVSGRVEKIGLRFTVLINFYHQRIMIPNRTIANVSRFPPGGVDAYADVQLPAGADPHAAAPVVEGIARGMQEQFSALVLSEPTIEKVDLAPGGGGSFFRVHFKIMPGQGSLIETTFRQRMISAMKTFDPNYADWQMPVTYRAVSTFKR
jgi:moderate conductance mechanosensitive channel